SERVTAIPMAKLLDGKVAVVTGSGRGIGRGIALALAREGARVVVNDVGCDVGGRGTAADPAAEVCKEIAALGSEAVPSYDSVAEFESAGRIVKTALDEWSRCDILVNNAGILRDKSLANMEPADFDAVLKVHLYGGFNCCRHALPVMKEQNFGRRGYAYTLFQTPKPIAALYKEGGFTAAEIAKNFDAVFREHLSVPGIPPTPALQQAAAAAKKG